MRARCSRKQDSTIIRLTALFLIITVCGCGKNGPEKVPVHGTVTYKGQPVADGGIRFVPIEGTKGPTSSGDIVNGHYTVEARGGVPVGKHRVEIRILGHVDRPVKGSGEMSSASQIGSVGPPIFDSPNSPLTAKVPGKNNGKLDFTIRDRS